MGIAGASEYLRIDGSANLATFNGVAVTIASGDLTLTSGNIELTNGTFEGGLTGVDGFGILDGGVTITSDGESANDGMSIVFDFKDSLSADQPYGKIICAIDDPTSGSEDGRIHLTPTIAGTPTNVVTVDAHGMTIEGSSLHLSVEGAMCVGGTHSGSSQLWVKGGRLQVDNAEEIIGLNTTNGTGFSFQCDSSNDCVADAAGGVFDFERTIMFDDTTYTPSGTTQTIDLDEGNHIILDLGSTTGAPTITLSTSGLKSSKSASGRIKMTNDDPARDVTWAITGGGTLTLVDEPTYTDDAGGAKRIVTWDWDGSELVLFFTNAF